MSDECHDEFTIIPIRQEDCYRTWKEVKHLLIPAIEESNGRWKPEYVFSALVNGLQTLWVVGDGQRPVAAFTTEIAHYPERKMLAIHYLGGQGFDEWYPDLFREVTAFARHFGCSGVECNARFGFWKWFKRDGFRKQSVFYELDL